MPAGDTSLASAAFPLGKGPAITPSNLPIGSSYAVYTVPEAVACFQSHILHTSAGYFAPVTPAYKEDDSYQLETEGLTTNETSPSEVRLAATYTQEELQRALSYGMLEGVSNQFDQVGRESFDASCISEGLSLLPNPVPEIEFKRLEDSSSTFVNTLPSAERHSEGEEEDEDTESDTDSEFLN